MMLSVLRHTKTPVKFWFLKNYLSPTFKVGETSSFYLFVSETLSGFKKYYSCLII